jgi:hypothetical protein
VTASFDYDTTPTDSEVTLVHEGGDTVETNDKVVLNAQGGGSEVTIVDDSTEWSTGTEATTAASSTLTGSNGFDGETLRAIWRPPEGDDQVIGKSTAPSE